MVSNIVISSKIRNERNTFYKNVFFKEVLKSIKFVMKECQMFVLSWITLSSLSINYTSCCKNKISYNL